MHQCSCRYACPCMFENAPENCALAAVYHLEGGTVGGVDVAGLSFISVDGTPPGVSASRAGGDCCRPAPGGHDNARNGVVYPRPQGHARAASGAADDPEGPRRVARRGATGGGRADHVHADGRPGYRRPSPACSGARSHRSRAAKGRRSSWTASASRKDRAGSSGAAPSTTWMTPVSASAGICRTPMAPGHCCTGRTSDWEKTFGRRDTNARYEVIETAPGSGHPPFTVAKARDIAEGRIVTLQMLPPGAPRGAPVRVPPSRRRAAGGAARSPQLAALSRSGRDRWTAICTSSASTRAASR